MFPFYSLIPPLPSSTLFPYTTLFRSPPGGPHSRQPDPKEPIAPLELRPVHPPLVDGQLLPQSKVLEGELAVAAEQERDESEQMDQEDDHRARIFSGSEQTDQPLAHRTEFWRRTAPADRIQSEPKRGELKRQDFSGILW